MSQPNSEDSQKESFQKDSVPAPSAQAPEAHSHASEDHEVSELDSLLNKLEEQDNLKTQQAEKDSYKRFAVRSVIFCAVVTGFAVVISLAASLKGIIIDVLLALTLASALAPVAEKFEQRGISRRITVAVTYICIILFYAGLGYLVYKPFKEQVLHFIEQVPIYIDQIHDYYLRALDLAGDNAKLLKIDPSSFKDAGVSVLSKTVVATANLVEVLANAVLVLFLAAFFVVEAKDLWRKLLRWMPKKQRRRAASLIAPLENRMGGYVRGQILVSTAVAIFFAVGFTLIGVKYGLVLGLIAGLLNLIPFVGSMMATIIALFIAANQSLLTCGLTMLLFVVEQTIESNFIVPHFLGKQVDMHPLVVLFAILTGATVAGAAGAVVAVPTTAAIIYLAQELLLSKDDELEELN